MNLKQGVTLGDIGMSVVAIPRPGIGINEAREKWLAAKDDTGRESNKVLDFGDSKEPMLLVAKERTRTVAYEFVPEASPPGFTIEMAMEHMKTAGFDVRGEGPVSAAGYRTIVACERMVN